MINLITQEEIDDSIRVDLNTLSKLNISIINELISCGIIQQWLVKFKYNNISTFAYRLSSSNLTYSLLTFYQASKLANKNCIEEFQLYWNQNYGESLTDLVIFYRNSHALMSKEFITNCDSSKIIKHTVRFMENYD